MNNLAAKFAEEEKRFQGVIFDRLISSPRSNFYSYRFKSGHMLRCKGDRRFCSEWSRRTVSNIEKNFSASEFQY